MKRVTILGLTDTSASIVAGPFDLFVYAGKLWNGILGEPATPFFKAEIVSLDGGPFKCLGGLEMKAYHDIAIVKAEGYAHGHRIGEEFLFPRCGALDMKNSASKLVRFSHAAHDPVDLADP
jgi:hypothetical protein